jgi:acyl-CoA synthetase (AMP-forming)/AMP-acid ligase II
MPAAASIPELILRAARDPALRGRVALATATQRVTYRELESRIVRIAAALRAEGLARGERVGLLADRSADAAAGLLGIMTAGGAACVLDTRAAPADLALRTRSAGIVRLLVDDAHTPLALKIKINKINTLSKISAVSAATLAEPAASDDALLLFTSGSSGKPKAVRLSHGNLLANAQGVIERTGITPDDRLLHAMPLHHTNGINNQLIAPLACGATVILLERFRAETFFEEAAQHRPTYITGVPTMYARLLEQAPPTGALRDLRFARCGSAPLVADLHRKIENHLGVALVVSYGLSEATCTSAMNPLAARKIGSVGPALAGQDIAIFAPQGEQALACGAEGEICIAGPALMQGYVTSGDGDTGDGPQLRNGWLRTGDLGRLDADGYLSISGRLKDIIIRGGENLSPAAIESALRRHAAVKSCCVVGVPHTDLGEVPAAFVVLHTDQTATPDALKGLVAEQLSRTHVPQHIIFTDALPEIGIGKIDRRALKMRADGL